MDTVIYAIINILDKNQYIGSAKHLPTRKRIHINSLKQNKHHSIYLQRAWNKHGEENFKFVVLETCTLETLIEREQWWLDNNDPVYNISKTAGSSLGIKRRLETIEKCRQAHKGEKHPEWRRKLKSIAQGGENHWTKKKKFSEESKKRMSNAQKELHKNGYIHPLNRAIIQYDLNNNILREWSSAAEAGRFYKKDRRAIVNNLRNKSKTSLGFIWKYKK
ncbi:MAG: GIY-YIG nuclease family protein [Richelia sp. RM2_1_2]|nr:GIY-YIG nuclease family protein [Richelia sp. RM2_1_2]